MEHRIINGFKINGFHSKNDFINHIKNKKKILVAMNAEKIVNENQKLKEIVNSNISYPDGAGCVMALKQKKLNVPKISGSNLWLDIVSKFQYEKNFYLIGSTKTVINATVDKLKKEYPSIQIVGYRNGFLKENDEIELIQDLKEKAPHIIFVAQGSPKQEFFMKKLIEIYPALYMGLGGSFDLYSTHKRGIPKIFINLQLEWFYRLLQNPFRVKRIGNLFKFFLLLIMRRL